MLEFYIYLIFCEVFCKLYCALFAVQFCVFDGSIDYQCCALVYILDSSYIPQCHHAVCVMTSLITFRVFHENIQWYINQNVFYDTLFFYLINFLTCASDEKS